MPDRYTQRSSRAGRRQTGVGEMLLDVALGRFEPGRAQRFSPARSPLLRRTAGESNQPTQVLQNRVAKIGPEEWDLRNRGISIRR